MTQAHNRATMYLEPELHKALRLKAINTRHSVSHLINLAVRAALREDEADLVAFWKRAHEKTLSYDEFLKDLKKHWKL